MASQVTLTVNDRSFNLACEAGDEARLQKLAAYVDERVRAIAESGIVRKESDLMALTAMVLADELFEAQKNSASSESDQDQISPEDFAQKLTEALVAQEQEYAKQVDSLTKTVKKLAENFK